MTITGVLSLPSSPKPSSSSDCRRALMLREPHSAWMVRAISCPLPVSEPNRMTIDLALEPAVEPERPDPPALAPELEAPAGAAADSAFHAFWRGSKSFCAHGSTFTSSPSCSSAYASGVSATAPVSFRRLAMI